MSYPWVHPDARMLAGSVDLATVEQDLRGLPHRITDEQIEKDKAGNRGLFLAQFLSILDRCDNGDPDDPRWDELRLRCLKEMARLTRVYEPDAPTVKQGAGNPKDLADAAAAALVELEASLTATRIS